MPILSSDEILIRLIYLKNDFKTSKNTLIKLFFFSNSVQFSARSDKLGWNIKNQSPDKVKTRRIKQSIINIDFNFFHKSNKLKYLKSILRSR